MPPGKPAFGGLIMECEKDELSPAQVAAYNCVKDQVALFNKNLEDLSKSKQVVIENLGEMTLLQFQMLTSQVTSPPVSGGKKLILQPNQQNILMMDPKAFNALLATSSGHGTPPTPSTVSLLPGAPSVSKAPPVAIPRTPAAASPTAPKKTATTPATSATPRIRVRGGLSGGNTATRGRGTAVRGKSPAILGRGSSGGSARGSTTTPSRVISPRPPASAPRSSSSGSLGVVDLTEEDPSDELETSHHRADSREVTIAKSSEKTFPSLVVLARPYLGAKAFDNKLIALERTALDDRVKHVLTLTASQLTEWLLQHGLLRSEQQCNAFGGKGKTHLPLKLGMYSDTSKFPYSGGYVWISECCPSQFVSVFSGSLFEAVPHPPSTIIKLIYHWSCQTGVQNVIQWVKVDNLFVKTLYTNLRAVCTAAVHQKFPIFGGPGKRVQIGVISLGTTTQDGASRQVKVEVLGIFDNETRMIRIRAVDPVPPDPTLTPQDQMKKRFQKTLDLLPKWVDRSSEIIIDFTVDKPTLVNFGYEKVIQVGPNDPVYKYDIMDYLRKIIPRMFQNTLSLLSRQIIQQFLDELSWRESFGAIPSRAFERMVDHIGEQTRLNTGGTLLNRLSRISLNPFKNWAYDKWGSNCKYVTPLAKVQSSTPQQSVLKTPKTTSSNESGKAASGPATSHAKTSSQPETPNSSSSQKKKEDTIDPTMIALEPYYYGVLDGTKKSKYVPFFTQCYFCRTDFKNVLKLTDHLILHALNKNLESVNDPKDICRSCLKIRLPGSKQHHQQQMCRNGPGTLGCRICAIKIKDKGSLVYHMTKTHHQLDMPYLCGKCGYRVSEYDLLNQHFLKVHNNSNSGMCPFCLKIIDFTTEDGNDIEQNQVFFTKHIQRHALPSSKKCSRCLLNFVNKSILAAHEVEMHSSQNENPDVMRFLVDDPTLMPAPIMEPPLMHSVQPGDLKPTGLLKGISTVTLGVMGDLEGEESVRCHECESPVLKDHYVNYLMCNKCSYRTCCAHAMAEHVSLIHPPYPLSSPVHVGMKTTLPIKAFCSDCNFTSHDGNAMSQHLVKCGYEVCHLGMKKRVHRQEVEEISLPVQVKKTRLSSSGGGGGTSSSTTTTGSTGAKRSRRRKRQVASETSEEDEDDEYKPPPHLRPKTSLRSVKKSSEDDEASRDTVTSEGGAMDVEEGVPAVDDEASPKISNETVPSKVEASDDES